MAGITQIGPMAEIMRANSVNGGYDDLCMSTTRLGTREWLKNIEKDIIDNGGSIACYAQGDAYCISSKLSSGKHYCTLHTGSKGKGVNGCAGVSTGCGFSDVDRKDSMIEIDDNDKKCSTDSDCAVISVHCGDCKYEAVNRKMVDKYRALLDKTCRALSSPACDTDWRVSHEPKCVASTCKLVRMAGMW